MGRLSLAGFLLVASGCADSTRAPGDPQIAPDGAAHVPDAPSSLAAMPCEPHDSEDGVEHVAEIPAPHGGPTGMLLAGDRFYFRMRGARGRGARGEISEAEPEIWSVSLEGGVAAPDPDSTPRFSEPTIAEVDDGYFTGMEGALVHVFEDGHVTPIAALDYEVGECLGLAADDDELFFTLSDGWLWSVSREPNGQPEKRFLGGATDCDDDYNGLMVTVVGQHVFWVGGARGERTSDGDPLHLYRACTE